MTAVTVSEQSFTEEQSADSVPRLPVDPELLEPADRALLERGMEELWAALSDDGRDRLLRRLRAREAKFERRKKMRARRSELSARYVDLLFSLPSPTDPGYDAAMTAMLEAKEAYLSYPKAY